MVTITLESGMEQVELVRTAKLSPPNQIISKSTLRCKFCDSELQDSTLVWLYTRSSSFTFLACQACKVKRPPVREAECDDVWGAIPCYVFLLDAVQEVPEVDIDAL